MTNEIPNMRYDGLCKLCGKDIRRAHTDGKCMPLAERMKNADWWFEWSDDYSVRQRGRAEIAAIRRELAELAKTEPETARQLMKDFGPDS